MDWHSLELLEYDRVTAAIAGHAECDAARARLREWRPWPDAARRAGELERLSEALRRTREPGSWCAVGRGTLAWLADPEAEGVLDGPALVDVLGWLEAARATREAWTSEDAKARHPRLAEAIDQLPDLHALQERLAASLDPDGRVKDSASPELARARRELGAGERRLHQQLERWAAPFGEGAYVTRHGDRFVALVPAAGFARKRGIVHDVSNSGQSLFVEPLEMCEANNHLLEVRGRAADEERRILRELASTVATQTEPLLALEEALAHLDTLRARARWAGEFGGIALTPAGDALRLKRARHPLLAMGERREQVVPLDLVLESPGRLLLVSGPNMGGKTVLLKTVGLAVALAHSAIPVLADEGSTVPELDELRADVGDEQSVDQGLSTFAAHLKALAAMAEAAGPRCLVLCDELGAGTDPEEGAALGRALLEHFATRGTWGVVTTHLGSLKRASVEVAGIVNGSLEFDLERLAPRYRFVPGVPGASHALSVATRLGFPSSVLDRAKSLTSEESRALERLLAEVIASRRAADEERVTLAAARDEADRRAAEHRNATEEARRTVEDLRRRLTRESEVLLARARELWQLVQRDAKRADKTRADADRLKHEMESIESGAEALQKAATPAALGLSAANEVQTPVTVEPGLRVHVKDLGIEAEVVSGPDPEGRVQLRRGAWKIQSHVAQLAPVSAGAARPDPNRRPVATYDPADVAPQLEVDLRGMDVDEALQAVDHGLDRAVLSGFHELRIIHGIGKGVLKAAVERHLRAHAQVESQRMGEGHEGGRGVTVARLR